ncbi:MAG: hypothetical protein KDA63_01985, partial [Planctomycetales bacterium]|nr:hypothetical protein [Planctomycetales bacterium]
IGDGSGATVTDGGGNLIGTAEAPIDPLLGPLADNGGPTLTHALLPGSPAVDAGNPDFSSPPATDQRGYYRVIDGNGNHSPRIDIGAFEYLSVAPLAGDGTLDTVVDEFDYLLWADHFDDDHALDPPGSPRNGDYNDDGVIDGLDYLVWAANYGRTLFNKSLPEADALRDAIPQTMAADQVFSLDTRSAAVRPRSTALPSTAERLPVLAVQRVFEAAIDDVVDRWRTG